MSSNYEKKPPARNNNWTTNEFPGSGTTPSMLGNYNYNQNSNSTGLSSGVSAHSSIAAPPVLYLDDIISDEDKGRLQTLIVDEGLQFVGDQEDYLCSNCGLVPIFHQMFPCGHNYCRDCYKLFREKGRKCRKCRSDIGSSEALQSEALEQTIGYLIAMCPNQSAGCQEQIVLGQLLAHLDICHFGKYQSGSPNAELAAIKRRLDELAGSNKRLAEEYEVVKTENKRLRTEHERTKLDSEFSGKSSMTKTVEQKPIVIFVRTVNGKRLPLTMLASDPVEMIRSRIIEMDGPLPQGQQLVFKGVQLRDGLTLADYSIRRMATVRAVVRHPEGSIRLPIKIAQGRASFLSVEMSDTVLRVKERVQALEGIPVDRQGLKLNTNKLLDDRQLCDYNFKADSLLHVAIRQITQPVPIELLSGRPVTVDVFASDTIRNVKAKLQDMEGVAAERQCIYHKAQWLPDDEVLRDHLVPGTSCLHMLVRPEDALRVIVHLRFPWLDRTFPLWLSTGDKVQLLRAKIGLLVRDVPTLDLRLFYQNRLMTDGNILSEFGMWDDAVVVVNANAH